MRRNGKYVALIFWFLVFIGLILINVIGVIGTVIIIAIAQSFRDPRSDKERLSVNLYKKKYGWYAIVYYLIVVVLAIYYSNDEILSMHTGLLVVILFFPMLFTLFALDIYEVFGRKTGIGDK